MAIESRKWFAWSGWVAVMLAAFACWRWACVPAPSRPMKYIEGTLVMKDFRFEPATLRLKAGEAWGFGFSASASTSSA